MKLAIQLPSQSKSPFIKLSNESFSMVKDSLLAITGDPGEALALNSLLSWTEVITKTNVLPAGKGTTQVALHQKRDGWIYKSSQQLAEETKVYKKTKMSKCLQSLVNKGLLEKRRNPTNVWDKTYQYKVNIDKVNNELTTYYHCTLKGTEYIYGDSYCSLRSSLNTFTPGGLRCSLGVNDTKILNKDTNNKSNSNSLKITTTNYNPKFPFRNTKDKEPSNSFIHSADSSNSFLYSNFFKYDYENNITEFSGIIQSQILNNSKVEKIASSVSTSSKIKAYEKKEADKKALMNYITQYLNTRNKRYSDKAFYLNLRKCAKYHNPDKGTTYYHKNSELLEKLAAFEVEHGLDILTEALEAIFLNIDTGFVEIYNMTYIENKIKNIVDKRAEAIRIAEESIELEDKDMANPKIGQSYTVSFKKYIKEIFSSDIETNLVYDFYTKIIKVVGKDNKVDRKRQKRSLETLVNTYGKELVSKCIHITYDKYKFGTLEDRYCNIFSFEAFVRTCAKYEEENKNKNKKSSLKVEAVVVEEDVVPKKVNEGKETAAILDPQARIDNGELTLEKIKAAVAKYGDITDMFDYGCGLCGTVALGNGKGVICSTCGALMTSEDNSKLDKYI